MDGFTVTRNKETNTAIFEVFGHTEDENKNRIEDFRLVIREDDPQFHVIPIRSWTHELARHLHYALKKHINDLAQG